MTFWQPVVKFSGGGRVCYEYHCTEIFGKRPEAFKHGEKVRDTFAVYTEEDNITLTVETESLCYDEESVSGDAVQSRKSGDDEKEVPFCD